MEKIVPANIAPGFLQTGIYPFNRNSIPETRYAPASVTDQPEFEGHASSDDQTEPSMAQDVTLQPDGILDEEDTRERLRICEDPATPRINLTDTRPLPKVSKTTPKSRRSKNQLSKLGRTRILTDTPETNIIAEHHKRQKEKIVKSRRRLQSATEKIKNRKGSLKKNSYIATTTIAPSDDDSSVKENVNVPSMKPIPKNKCKCVVIRKEGRSKND
ncbi:hypothetical protein GHT06_017109 [Daphnia sinensis]|uniref:Uncharacterized protein n=1 Tax=Daphnia sinensis TaxID=1820382 RepID=A0AAD5KPE8_9CRUS|nr:hypothetical protein GHT06_017109 [Daphnia sinensis]